MNCSKYQYKFTKAICHFPHDRKLAFELFKSIYNEIPIEERLNILNNVIYAEFKIDTTIIDWIQKILDDESVDIKEQRLHKHSQLLKKYINTDDTITIYRGINSSNYGINGISWTLDKLIAEVFSLNGISSQVITAKVHINDVLAYNSNIDEEEVIVLPVNIDMLTIEPVERDPELFKYLEERRVIFDKELTDFVLEKG